MSAAQGETADQASEERSEGGENSKGTDNSEEDHSGSESISYEDSTASSMEDKSDGNSGTNQDDSDKENTRPKKRQKQVRIAGGTWQCHGFTSAGQGHTLREFRMRKSLGHQVSWMSHF
jgi:hypothetical protein